MKRACLLIALGIAAASPLAEAAEVRSGPIAVSDAWARGTTASAKAGGAFLTIANTGAAPDRLLSAVAEVAERAEIHATVESEGVMRMREVDGGVPLPPGQAVEFRPGGYHVMLMGLKRPLIPGEPFPLTLTFEKAGSVQVEIEIKPATYAPASAAHGQHGRHGTR